LRGKQRKGRPQRQRPGKGTLKKGSVKRLGKQLSFIRENERGFTREVFTKGGEELGRGPSSLIMYSYLGGEREAEIHLNRRRNKGCWSRAKNEEAEHMQCNHLP